MSMLSTLRIGAKSVECRVHSPVPQSVAKSIGSENRDRTPNPRADVDMVPTGESTITWSCMSRRVRIPGASLSRESGESVIWLSVATTRSVWRPTFDRGLLEITVWVPNHQCLLVKENRDLNPIVSIRVTWVCSDWLVANANNVTPMLFSVTVREFRFLREGFTDPLGTSESTFSGSEISRKTGLGSMTGWRCASQIPRECETWPTGSSPTTLFILRPWTDGIDELLTTLLAKSAGVADEFENVRDKPEAPTAERWLRNVDGDPQRIETRFEQQSNTCNHSSFVPHSVPVRTRNSVKQRSPATISRGQISAE